MDVNSRTQWSKESSSSQRSAVEPNQTRAMGDNHLTSFERNYSIEDDDRSTGVGIKNNIVIDDDDFDQIPRDKSVRFSSVDIRDYSLCIGDNPSVSRGVPISLDWDYDEEHSHDINNYEHSRFGDRRESEALKLPSLQRVQVLKKLGYSRGEINEQVKEVVKVKQKRILTRRKVEREDRVKASWKAIRKTIESIIPKSERRSCVAKAQKCDISPLLEREDDTLASSISSKKSEFSECSGTSQG